jgi:hypothetical protein
MAWRIARAGIIDFNWYGKTKVLPVGESDSDNRGRQKISTPLIKSRNLLNRARVVLKHAQRNIGTWQVHKVVVGS